MKDSSKIWQKLKERITNELPQSYHEDKWAEMEALLNEETAIQSKNKDRRFLLLFFIICLAGFLFLHFHNNLFEKSSARAIDKNTTSENKMISLNKKHSQEGTTKNINENNILLTTEKKQQTTTRTIYKKSSQLTSGITSKDTFLKNSPDQKTTLDKQLNNKKYNHEHSDKTLTKAPVLLNENQANLILAATTQERSNSVVAVQLSRKKVEHLFSKEESLDIPMFPIKPQRKKIGFGISVGINAAVPEKQQFSFSAIPAVFAFYPITEKWKLQLEFNYKKITNYNQSYSLTSTLNSNNFGNPIYFFERRSKLFALSFAEASLIAKYSNHPKISYLIGGRYSRIIGGRIDAGSSTNNGGAAISIPYIEPTWKNSYAGIFGVEFKVTPQLSFDLRYNQGFIDLTPDNLYQEKVNHLNSDLQLSIRFRIK